MQIDQSPPSPRTPQPPPKSLAHEIKTYLRSRQIWETTGDSFALNDVVSTGVRRDTLRLRIRQEHWLGL